MVIILFYLFTHKASRLGYDSKNSFHRLRCSQSASGGARLYTGARPVMLRLPPQPCCGDLSWSHVFLQPLWMGLPLLLLLLALHLRPEIPPLIECLEQGGLEARLKLNLIR